jgi:hypothetical protein
MRQIFGCRFLGSGGQAEIDRPWIWWTGEQYGRVRVAYGRNAMEMQKCRQYDDADLSDDGRRSPGGGFSLLGSLSTFVGPIDWLMRFAINAFPLTIATVKSRRKKQIQEERAFSFPLGGFFCFPLCAFWGTRMGSQLTSLCTAATNTRAAILWSPVLPGYQWNEQCRSR